MGIKFSNSLESSLQSYILTQGKNNWSLLLFFLYWTSLTNWPELTTTGQRPGQQSHPALHTDTWDPHSEAAHWWQTRGICQSQEDNRPPTDQAPVCLQKTQKILVKVGRKKLTKASSFLTYCCLKERKYLAVLGRQVIADQCLRTKQDAIKPDILLHCLHKKMNEAGYLICLDTIKKLLAYSSSQAFDVKS